MYFPHSSHSVNTPVAYVAPHGSPYSHGIVANRPTTLSHLMWLLAQQAITPVVDSAGGGFTIEFAPGNYYLDAPVVIAGPTGGVEFILRSPGAGQVALIGTFAEPLIQVSGDATVQMLEFRVSNPTGSLFSVMGPASHLLLTEMEFGEYGQALFQVGEAAHLTHRGSSQVREPIQAQAFLRVDSGLVNFNDSAFDFGGLEVNLDTFFEVDNGGTVNASPIHFTNAEQVNRILGMVRRRFSTVHVNNKTDDESILAELPGGPDDLPN